MTLEEGPWLKLNESDRVGRQYVARFLLMGIVNREIAVEQTAEKPDDGCQKDLDFLISQYYSGIDFCSHEFLGNNIERFQNALDAIAFNARVKFASKIFARLLNATKPNRRKEMKISLTDTEIVLDEAYGEIFLLSIESLVGAGKTGAAQACHDILSCFSGNNPPLLAYSSQAAAELANPSGIIGKTTFYVLPTKIPNIDAQYSYHEADRYPEVSLIVRPFE